MLYERQRKQRKIMQAAPNKNSQEGMWGRVLLTSDGCLLPSHPLKAGGHPPAHYITIKPGRFHLGAYFHGVARNVSRKSHRFIPNKKAARGPPFLVLTLLVNYIIK